MSPLWLLLLGCRPIPDTGTGPAGRDSDSDTDEPPTPVDEHVWVEVSTNPCARDEDGWVHCWSSASWPIRYFEEPTSPVERNPAPVHTFVAPSSRWALGIRRADDLVVNWWCKGEPPPPPGGPGRYPPCDPLARTATALADSCALSPTGEVYWWYDPGIDPALVFPPEKSYHLLAGTWNYCAALADDNMLYGGSYFDGVSGLGPQYVAVQLDPGRQIVELAAAGVSVCALDTDGLVTCHGGLYPPFAPDPPSFPNPPYARVAGGSYSVCAQRLLDDVIECNDGSTHAFGQIRDLAVNTFDERGSFSEPPPDAEPASLCVITEGNRIRCAGPRYPDDLLDLPPPGWSD